MQTQCHLYVATLRARAEQCRTVAETFRDLSVKRKMLNVASGYDELANAAECFGSHLSTLPRATGFPPLAIRSRRVTPWVEGTGGSHPNLDQ